MALPKQAAFASHSQLLKRASEMLYGRQLRQVEFSRRTENQASENVLLNMFRTKSIATYVKYLDHIADEIIRTDDEKFVFRLPSLRTLMDIYARFQYAHDPSIESSVKILTILTHELLTFHNTANPADFNAILSLHREYLDNNMPDYPRNWDHFEYSWFQRKKLLFPNWRQALSEEKLSQFRKLSSQVFGAKRQYQIYSYVSELIHGNPYLKHGMGRERYWLASMAISTSAGFLELIDEKVFEENSMDFKAWLKDVSDVKVTLVPHWKNEKAIEKY